MTEKANHALYQEIILTHFKKPHQNFTMADHDFREEQNNPLCGDSIELYLKLKPDNTITPAFQGRGCAISQASASILMSIIKDKTIEECHKVITDFENMMQDITVDHTPVYKDLEALQSIKKYPVRMKCARLAWDTLKDLLTKNNL